MGLANINRVENLMSAGKLERESSVQRQETVLTGCKMGAEQTGLCEFSEYGCLLTIPAAIWTDCDGVDSMMYQWEQHKKI